jgi:hypothetical protein
MVVDIAEMEKMNIDCSSLKRVSTNNTYGVSKYRKLHGFHCNVEQLSSHR